jgi:hypothetical protein
VSTLFEPSAEEAAKERRPYEAPRVARVDLKADEVLAIGCKTLRAGRAFGQSCVITTCGVRDKS